MIKAFCIASLLIVLGLASAAGAEEPAAYAWPTDASRLLTSTFGEYRGHRFHAGMDVKTFGQVGYKAFAVRPGWVSRVEVSPSGYGRVVFLTLDTGETAVYGHLQKFNGEIARRVKEEQQRSGRYSVALRFAANEIPVAQGEIIGWTGQSGSGAPHLHFELRDAAENPLNPLLKGYQVRDTIPPSIRKVMVIPLDAHARVAGDLAPLVLLPRAVQPGRLQIERTIPVFGRVAFAAEFLDQIDGASNRMNLYGYRLIVDDQEIFSTRYDRYDYDLDPQADLDRDYRALVRDQDIYQRLFRDTGNRLPFYASEKPWYGMLECDPASSSRSWLSSITRALGFFWDLPAGATILEKGLHPFRIEAFDFNGNRSVVEGRLQVGPPVEKGIESAGVGLDKAGYTLDADYYDSYVRIAVTASQPVRGIPGLTACYGDGYCETIELERSGRAAFRAGVPLYHTRPGPVRLRLFDPAGDEDKPLHDVMLNYITVRQGREKMVVTQDGLCELAFGEESLWKSIFIRARTRNRGAEKLPLESKIYQIDPADLPLGGLVTVQIRAEAGLQPEQVALYRRAPGREWQYIGRESGTSGRIGSRSRELGEFALIRDSVAPAVAILKPAQGARLTQRTPLLVGTLHDALSGIGTEEDYRLLLDGQRVIAEYDPEGRRLSYQVETPLSPGVHTIEIIARDRAGNQASSRHQFHVL
jgi:hypothetical protein